MGLFDFFKRKPTPPSDGEGPSPDYVLAHVALRQIVQQSPLGFLSLAASPQFSNVLADIMADVAKLCGRPVTFSAEQVKAHPLRVHIHPCAILEFPEPREMAEVHMLAVVALIDLTKDPGPIDPTTKIESRYFTLEKGFTTDSTPRTVLCEWDETSHMNYGDGPPANVEDFAAAIEELLNGAQQQR